MKKLKEMWNNSCFERYCFGILIAIELLMSFTFLGYIHIPPISITIAYLPIVVAGCLLGPAQSAAAGFVFGIASMYKASSSYVMPADRVFSPFLSEFPLGSLWLSVGTRTLFGLLIGLAFAVVKKRKHNRLWRIAVCAIAPKLHTMLVYVSMGILFPDLGYGYRTALHLKWRDVVFSVICILAVQLLWSVYHSDTVQNVRLCINQRIHNPFTSEKMNLFFRVFEFFMVCTAIIAAVYFSQRETYMLQQHGVTVTPMISADLLRLQIQFLIAFLSLNFISIFLLICIYKYMSYREYRGEMDDLTNVMGRRMFIQYCNKAQKDVRADTAQSGWFLFVDVDYFKEINDTFGHTVGDQVLREIAVNLQNIFADAGRVGRVGGDEFAAILDRPISQQVMKQKLDHFLECISGILADRKVSCSIGAYQFVFPQSVKHLLSETDYILYEAKEKGRACYVIKSCVAEQR
ncbi:diguanylate cyclase [Lachnospiraceae bacterium 45-W7]